MAANLDTILGVILHAYNTYLMCKIGARYTKRLLKDSSFTTEACPDSD